jgi:hypothetical protein
MAKVYFDKENHGHWVVESLEDYYSFKAVNFETNEESNQILSWSRNYDLKDHDSKIDRVYDVEIDREKYYFLFLQEKNNSPTQISKIKLKLIFEKTL